LVIGGGGATDNARLIQPVVGVITVPQPSSLAVFDQLFYHSENYVIMVR